MATPWVGRSPEGSFDLRSNLSMRFHNFVQVAGVIDQNEADLLIRCGVQFLGFPLRLSVHQEDLSEAAAAAIIRGLPETVEAVAITYLSRADEILEFCHFLGVRVVQLHGPVATMELAELKAAHPPLAVIKSLVVGHESNDRLFDQLAVQQRWVDLFIIDTFDASSGASGATGKTHDWGLSREIVARCPRPVILAGGLTPENVAAAIQTVRPAGVDAHTGLEDYSGRKCPAKVTRFVKEANAAFQSLA